MGKSFDTQSFGTGLFKGIVENIDRRAEEKKRELDLQRDVTKHILQKKADYEMQKNWLEEMKSQLPGQQGFIKETKTPAEGMAELFGIGETAPQARAAGTLKRVPYVATEETETGRRPIETSQYDVDYGAIGRATVPTVTSTGISVKPMAAKDKMLNIYNALKKIEDSGRPLNPQQQYMKKGLEKKLFGVGGKEAKITESKRKIIGILRSMIKENRPLAEIHKYIDIKGYEPDEFADELEGYTATKQPSMLENIKQAIINSPQIKTVSQALNYIMQTYNMTRDKAIETLKGMQE